MGTSADMLISKCLVSVLIVYFVQGTLCKPAETNITEGRGIGSTIWGWISYPYSWWTSHEDEPVPFNDHLIASTTYGPYDNIEIGKHNVTIWCNDQTCTTMKCDKKGCKNNTCNIYDTDMTGECREYHTIIDPEEPFLTEIPHSGTKPLNHNEITEDPIKEHIIHSTKAPDTTTTASVDESNKEPNKVIGNHATNSPEMATSVIDELKKEDVSTRPLELEAVLSSTVTEMSTNEQSASHHIKV